MRHYYTFFYRIFGAWKVEHLVSPRLFPMTELVLPRNSMYHILPDAGESITPNLSDPILQGWQKPISLYNVTELTRFEGKPRRISYDANSDINKFLTKNNQQFRRLKDPLKPVPDDQALVAFSYAVLPRIYYYAKTNYSDWDQYYNLLHTVLSNANAYAEQSKRQQFIVLEAPTLVPSIEFLKNAERAVDIDQKIVKDFNTPGRRLVLELFKWLSGGYRANSLFSQIDLKNLDRINLVLQLDQNFTLINLGTLFSWRAASKSETDVWAQFDKLAGKGMPPQLIQRVLVRFFVGITRTKSVSADIDTLDAEITDSVDITDETDTSKTVEATSTTDVKTEVVGSVNKNILDEDADEEALNNEQPDAIILDKTTQKELEEDLKVLEKMNQVYDEETPDSQIEVKSIYEVENVTIYDAVTKKCDQLAEKGMLSAAEYKRHIRLSESYKKITLDGKPLAELIKPPENLFEYREPKPFTKTENIKDERMLKSSISTFDKDYNDIGHSYCVSSVLMSVQKAGISVADIQKERVDMVTGSSEIYSVRLVPVQGEPSTIKIRIPVFDDTGMFRSNNVKYRFRKQKGDNPIRKIGPNVVELSSYYGPKLFVTRAAKRNNNYAEWLTNQIRLIAFDPENKNISNLHSGNDFDNDFKCVRIYSTLARYISSMQIREFECMFDHTRRVEEYGLETIAKYEGKTPSGRLIFGRSPDDRYLVFGTDSLIYIGENGLLRPVGDFETYVGIDTSTAPIEKADIRIIDKNISVGVMLAYEMGLEKLLKSLKASYILHDGRVRIASKTDSHFTLYFKDSTLQINRTDPEIDLILSGFLEYHDFLKTRTFREFNNKDVYLPLIESRKLTLKYLNEIDNLYDMFIDPITETLLKQLKEPTTFRGLILRSIELLLIDHHPAEMDTEFQRLKGNERVAGAIYKELVRSIRRHRTRADKSRAPIEMNPHAVWTAISQDSSKLLVDEINPIENLKEIEAVTYSGTGGRTAETMMAKARLYSKKDMGIISEAGVDSGDVGVNIWTSANPNITSIFGTTKQLDGDYDPTKLFSTSTLLAPFADKEDGKRVTFTGIQNKHTVSCVGYQAPAVRTGYEYVVPHRTGDLFCTTAKQSGVVESVTEDGIIVKYQDGTKKGIQLGRRYGVSTGNIIPHSLITQMKPGQRFHEGDVIAYNEKFFEPDYFNPKQVLLKFNTTAKIGLFEHPLTEEDSCLITPELGERLKTQVGYLRTVVVSFKDTLAKIVSVGDTLTPQDVLCYIQPEVAAAASGIDDAEALAALTEWSSQTPKAKYKGTIERIECFYHGVLDDMSPSVRKLAEVSDKAMKARCKAAGEPVYTGLVDDSYRLEGEALPLDSMAINFYMTSMQQASVGDKIVFANQLKSVIGEVIAGSYITESGVKLEGIFGQASIDDRIVDSAPRTGALTTLLKVIATKTISAYRNL